MQDDDRISVPGCLSGENGKFGFSSYSGQKYDLVGTTTLINRHGGWPPGNNVCVQGTLTSPRVIKVNSIKNLPRPEARLIAAIGHPSQWRPYTYEKYGVAFVLPKIFSVTEDDQYIQSNFPIETGAITVRKFAIPQDTFLSPNDLGCGQLPVDFFGGSIALFVNPGINNGPACAQFGGSDPTDRPSPIVDGVKYSKTSDSSVGMGTGYGYDYYNTFQNGLCYEFVFSSGGTNPNPDSPCGCAVPTLADGEYDRLEKTILEQFSFSMPQITTAVPNKPASSPKVLSFEAYPLIATQPDGITFSWSTKDADFVRLSYSCTAGEEIPDRDIPNLGLDGVIIMETGGADMGCGGKFDRPETVNHSPDSSLDVDFGNSSYDAPIQVRVTLTPFSHGVAYPKAAKTIPISVYPSSTQPESDVPGGAVGTVTVISPPDTKQPSSYKQGSKIKIEWVDSGKIKTHYWVHLVQDKPANRRVDLYQIAGYIPGGAESTSCMWLVPKSYSGSGFRIFISSESHLSETLPPSDAFSAPFNIVP
jgi:hypothetical protein